MAARKERGVSGNPCKPQIDRVMNAMEAADYNLRPIYKYIQEMEKCFKEVQAEANKRGRASTIYHLKRYVDQQKHKQK